MNRAERIDIEIELLRSQFPDLDYRHPWVRLPKQHLPDGWKPSITDVAFVIGDGHPGTPPYGLYVPAGIQFKGQVPQNYTEPAQTQPPFDGRWGTFSWTVSDPSQWQPSSDVRHGANLLRWARSFYERFEEGA